MLLLAGAAVAGGAILLMRRKPGGPTPAPGTPVINLPPAGSGGTRSTLGGGQTLASGTSLTSPNGQCRFAMQSDGNLVVYVGGVAKWQSGTAGRSGAFAVMQTDGNLVVYLGGTALWQSGTAGNPGAVVSCQDDGNVVVYASGGAALWQSHTYAGATTGGGTPTPPPCTQRYYNSCDIIRLGISNVLNAPDQGCANEYAQNALAQLAAIPAAWGNDQNTLNLIVNQGFEPAAKYKACMLNGTASSPTANEYLSNIRALGLTLTWGGSPAGWQVNWTTSTSCQRLAP